MAVATAKTTRHARVKRDRDSRLDKMVTFDIECWKGEERKKMIVQLTQDWIFLRAFSNMGAWRVDVY